MSWTLSHKVSQADICPNNTPIYTIPASLDLTLHITLGLRKRYRILVPPIRPRRRSQNNFDYPRLARSSRSADPSHAQRQTPPFPRHVERSPTHLGIASRPYRTDRGCRTHIHPSVRQRRNTGDRRCSVAGYMFTNCGRNRAGSVGVEDP